MSKYKAVRKKTDATTPQMRPGVPCLVILIGGMIGTMILLFLVMKNA